MLRQLILAASRSPAVARTVAGSRATRGIVDRFVAGQTVDDAVRVARLLAADGLSTSLDHLGEDVHDPAQARAAADACVMLVERLAAAGLTGRAEVSVKLSSLGQALDPALALEQAGRVCAAAAAAGTTVTVDMEDHTTTDGTLAAVAELRREWPWVGAVVQAQLRRSEADCRELATAGSRVRLCKGAYRAPGDEGFLQRRDVDRSYVRCLRVLMEGHGYPMVATHDPALLRVADALVRRIGRERGSYEYQMLYGVRPDEQRKLSGRGETVRVYVPYGGEWYPYLMRRLAERPANVAFFLRSLAGTS